MLSALPDDVAVPGPGFWEAASRDLAEPVELVGQGRLSCCSSPSSQSATRFNDNSLSVHQGALSELVPACAPGHVQPDTAHTWRNVTEHRGTASSQIQSH